MSYKEFCKQNCMTEDEIGKFTKWLEKRKDNLEPRSIQNWLYLFNTFFDDL
jgi:hypothetical protein